MLLRALFVFFAVAFADILWVRCVTNVSAGRRWRSAFWAVPLYAAQSISVISYVRDYRMIVPALLGAFVGTALGVRRDKKYGGRVQFCKLKHRCGVEGTCNGWPRDVPIFRGGDT